MTDEQQEQIADHGVATEAIDVLKVAITPSVGALWPVQNRRMRRSLRRLVALAQGERFGDSADSEEATDALHHFFQDAYHLKDWIKNDTTATQELKNAAEDLFCGGGQRCRRTHDLSPEVMRLCADLCNGAKHQTLDAARRFPDSGIASEHLQVRPATAGSGEAARPPLHSWSVLADGVERDALEIAHEIIVEWDRWMAAHGLDPSA